MFICNKIEHEIISEKNTTHQREKTLTPGSERNAKKKMFFFTNETH